MKNARHYQVAVIGAGFCGTMVAVQLARLVTGISIALIERNPIAGPGLAYGTRDADHLLNVRAGQMGAFAHDPAHFWRWLEANPNENFANNSSAQDFVSRKVFGHYLRNILEESRKSNRNLDLINQRIVNMRRLPNETFELEGSNGDTLTADRVVLALGNFPPDQLSDNKSSMNPYMSSTWQDLASDGDVLIVGTGLTSLDLVVTMAKTKSKGVIHLLSRHGLLPREHAGIVPYTRELKQPYPTTALGLLRALRKEISETPDIPWQSVVDALRPLNQLLWASLDLDEQRRFVRHLRAYWDVHRHRCAPKVMDAYRDLEKDGRVQLHHGSIVKQTKTDKGYEVEWRPRGHTMTEELFVRQVVRCTGPQADFNKLDDVLVQNLLNENLLTTDSLHLGVVAGTDYVVCDKMGDRIVGLYTLGSLLKGRLYESVAVPELRGQAADIAWLIAQDMTPKQI